jgi:hypothetical protein
MNHSTFRIVITFLKKENVFIMCSFKNSFTLLANSTTSNKAQAFLYTKVNQVCLLGSICMAIINSEILMVRRHKEQVKHSKMFTVDIILLFKTVSHRLQALLYILHISQSEGWAFINI